MAFTENYLSSTRILEGAMDHRNSVLAAIVKGKSFADVGGLWGGENEKVTVAHAAGAAHLAMIDIWAANDNWWSVFKKRCDDKGIQNVSKIVGSIDNPFIISAAGSYDIVHCSGVLYHCPNPLLTLRNLRAITREHLVIAVAVMPTHIENTHGSYTLSDEAAISIPCLEPGTRAIFSDYIEKMYGGGAWGVTGPVEEWYFTDGTPNYGPWWWLWTSGYFARLLRAAGLDVVESFTQFGGTGHLYVCSKSQEHTENYGNY